LAKGDITRLLSNSSAMSYHVVAAILDLIEPEIAPDHPLRRYSHSKFEISRGVHLEDPIWGKGRSQGVVDHTIRKSDGGFL